MLGLLSLERLGWMELCQLCAQTAPLPNPSVIFWLRRWEVSEGSGRSYGCLLLSVYLSLCEPQIPMCLVCGSIPQHWWLWLTSGNWGNPCLLLKVIFPKRLTQICHIHSTGWCVSAIIQEGIPFDLPGLLLNGSSYQSRLLMGLPLQDSKGCSLDKVQRPTGDWPCLLRLLLSPETGFPWWYWESSRMSHGCEKTNILNCNSQTSWCRFTQCCL